MEKESAPTGATETSQHPRIELLALWIELKEEYPALAAWTFLINKNKRRFGVCRYKKMTVEISEFLLDDLEKAKETLRHEAAHALAGYSAAHGPVWKKKALELGCSPTACGSSTAQAPPKFLGTCTETCQYAGKHRRYRLSKAIKRGYICKSCRVKIRWEEV